MSHGMDQGMEIHAPKFTVSGKSDQCKHGKPPKMKITHQLNWSNSYWKYYWAGSAQYSHIMQFLIGIMKLMKIS